MADDQHQRDQMSSAQRDHESEPETWRDRVYAESYRLWAVDNGWTPPSADAPGGPVAWRWRRKREPGDLIQDEWDVSLMKSWAEGAATLKSYEVQPLYVSPPNADAPEGPSDEKATRIRYQDIVYAICNLVDEARGDSGTARCTVDNVVNRLRDVLSRLDAQQKEKL